MRSAGPSLRPAAARRRHRAWTGLRCMGNGSRGGSGARMQSRWIAAVGVAMFWVALLAAQMGARGAQAQAGGNELLRFCPGLGIPCVEITRQAYDRGHEQFRQSCGFCHGPTAAGGNGGPNLIYSAVIRRDNQGADITKLIQEGRTDKGMPVIPLTQTQIADLVGDVK